MGTTLFFTSQESRIKLAPEDVGFDDAQEEEAQPYFEEEDRIQEEAAALWVNEDDER